MEDAEAAARAGRKREVMNTASKKVKESLKDIPEDSGTEEEEEMSDSSLSTAERWKKKKARKRKRKRKKMRKPQGQVLPGTSHNPSRHLRGGHGLVFPPKSSIFDGFLFFRHRGGENCVLNKIICPE